MRRSNALFPMLFLIGAGACGGGRIGDPLPLPTGAGTTPPATSEPADPNDGAALGPGANANLQAFAPFINAAASDANVPADLIASVIWKESRGVASVAGGGLMQVDVNAFAQMQAEHPALTGTLSDPQTAIYAGAYYLVEMQQAMQTKYNRQDWPITLRAYNSGENGVDPNDLNARPAGTGDPNYVILVMDYWQIIASGQGTLPP